MFPHEKAETAEHGRSPGNGITPVPISREPLATEGEATSGPDDYNPYEDGESGESTRLKEEPADGNDPYTLDDVGAGIDTESFPGFGADDDGPVLDF